MYLFAHTFFYLYTLVSLTFKLTLSPYPISPRYTMSLLFTICLIYFSYNFTLLSYLTVDQKCISVETVQTAD
jgi:hypothetical protein